MTKTNDLPTRHEEDPSNNKSEPKQEYGLPPIMTQSQARCPDDFRPRQQIIRNTIKKTLKK